MCDACGEIHFARSSYTAAHCLVIGRSEHEHFVETVRRRWQIENLLLSSAHLFSRTHTHRNIRTHTSTLTHTQEHPQMYPRNTPTHFSHEQEPSKNKDKKKIKLDHTNV